MERPASLNSMMRWFEPKVDQRDFFVRPNFQLGQFFYSSETAKELVDRLDRYQRPCCLCTPRLAWEWQRRGRVVRLLDCDPRFSTLPGFRQFDLLRPERMDEEFDVIIVDPIFIPAAQVRLAVDEVLHASGAGQTDVFVTFPVERERELTSSFAAYGLARLDVPLKHNNVKLGAEDRFALYGTRPL